MRKAVLGSLVIFTLLAPLFGVAGATTAAEIYEEQFTFEIRLFENGDANITLISVWLRPEHKIREQIEGYLNQTNGSVEDAVKMAGGEVVYTPVGSPVVAKVMIEKNAVFGGEGNGGLIFPEHLLARDGGMAIAKVLQLMDETGKKLSELAAEIPKYYMIKGKTPCKDKIKLLEGLKKEFPDANFIDGARIDYDDGWLLVRPSGTEPIVRIFAEGKTKERAEELYNLGLKTVKKILEH